MPTRGGDPDLSFEASEQGTKKKTKQAKTDAPAKITWQYIVNCFKEVIQHQQLREKWVSDEAWVIALTDIFNMDDLTISQFNKAIPICSEYSLVGTKSGNTSGVYRIRRNVRGL